MAFSPGDVVLVPFPYRDRLAERARPAVVVSSAGFILSGHQNLRGMNDADARLDWGKVRNLSQLPLPVGRRDNGPAQRWAAAAWLLRHGRADHRPTGNRRVTLQTSSRAKRLSDGKGGVAVAPARPRTRFVLPIAREQERYARKANQIVIHHELGDVVAVIEIVSPGNKDRTHSLRSFVDKAIDILQQQVNLLIIDPFPPGHHDPQGIHGAIWNEFTDQPFELPPDKPLTFAAYQVEPIKTAYVEPIAVADRLPDMPLFLLDEYNVNVPLEETYQTTWNVLPVEIRQLLEPPTQS